MAKARLGRREASLPVDKKKTQLRGVKDTSYSKIEKKKEIDNKHLKNVLTNVNKGLKLKSVLSVSAGL